MTSLADAVVGVTDGATVMIGGFGDAGHPMALLDTTALYLVVVNNNAGSGEAGLVRLVAAGLVAKIICSFPRQSDSRHFDEKLRAGEIEAVDLAVGARQTFAMMTPLDLAGGSELVPSCDYPVTAPALVDWTGG